MSEKVEAVSEWLCHRFAWSGERHHLLLPELRGEAEMSRILRPDAPLDMDTQARLLEQLLSVMGEAGVDVLEFGIHHLVQSKTSEVKNGNELTITLRYKKK